MAFPFSVGDQSLQGLLDWVAEPPPAQGRDTHALRFRLFKEGTGATLDTRDYSDYSGLMFYRPQGVGMSLVGRRPGLDGVGGLLATQDVCQNIVANSPPGQRPELVKVFLAFRQRQSGPAEVIATLTFMDGNLWQMPADTVGDAVEFSNIVLGGSGGLADISIHMDPPDGWGLLLQRATVLLKGPFF